MLNADYELVLKSLGKLCKLFDDAAASEVSQNLLRATALDQVSTGLAADLEASDIFASRQSGWASAIRSGPAALQTLAVSTARELLRSDWFTDKLVTNLPENTSITAVLDAWALEFETDSKTLTTGASTGLVNFLEEVRGSAWGTFEFPQSGTPSYDDSVYVVSAVI